MLSMHTVKPLDEEAVSAAARETAVVITVEEHSVTGGLGTAVGDVLAQSGLRLPRFRKFGLPDEVSHAVGSQAYLRRRCGDLVEIILSLTQARRAA